VPNYQFGVEVNYVNGSNPHKEFYQTGTQVGPDRSARQNSTPFFLVTAPIFNPFTHLYEVPGGDHTIIIDQHRLDFFDNSNNAGLEVSVVENSTDNFDGYDPQGNLIVNGTIWGGGLLVGGQGDNTFISNLDDDLFGPTVPVTMVGGGGNNFLQGGTTIYGSPSFRGSPVSLNSSDFPEVDPNFVFGLDLAMVLEPDQAGKETLIAPVTKQASIYAGAGKAFFEAGHRGAGDIFIGTSADDWFSVATDSGDLSITGGSGNNTLHYTDTKTYSERFAFGAPTYTHHVELSGESNGIEKLTDTEVNDASSTTLQTTISSGITSVEISHGDGSFGVADFIGNFTDFASSPLKAISIHFNSSSPSNTCRWMSRLRTRTA
jgi:hypothetical protein